MECAKYQIKKPHTNKKGRGEGRREARGEKGEREKKRKGDWRDGSVAQSTDCFSKGSEFNSQQPHGGSQPSVMGSDALFRCV